MTSGHVTCTGTIERPHRFLLLLPLLAVGSILITLLSLFVLRDSGEPELIGTDLGGSPAPDFTLTDYRGQAIRLSDFRGKVVVLTFIYTSCPDVCPILARNLSAAYEQLSDENRDDVVLVAITVDPEQDTPEALRAFSAQHGLADNPAWYALRGDSANLERVWHAYGIYPGTDPATPAHEHSAEQSPEATAPGGGEGHTDAIYLIDPEGRERVLMRSSIDPDSLTYNLEILAN